MTLHVQKIPPAPRRVRVRAVLLRGWGYGFFGIVAAGFGSLLTWMLWLAATSSHYAVAERRLAAGQDTLARADGEIFQVSVTRGEVVHLAFRFHDAGGELHEAECVDRIVPPSTTSRWHVGQQAAVEYVATTPHIARLVGTRVAFVVNWHRYGLWFLVAPGLLSLLLWVATMVRARRILASGDVALARQLRCRELALSMPTLLVVDFHFLDRNANRIAARETIPARSAIGRLAQTEDARLAVVHDRRVPERHVLAMPTDFVAEPDRLEQFAS